MWPYCLETLKALCLLWVNAVLFFYTFPIIFNKRLNISNITLSLQWDDSFDDLLEGSPSNRNRLQLPSPNKRVVSPLKKYEITKITRRRKMKKWSNLEEDTLRTGVQKYVIALIYANITNCFCKND